MEVKNLKTLQLLEEIAKDKPISQRELSDALQISLGLVNAFIKRLVKKGFCKVTTIPKKRVQYLLTPSGAMEKTRLTYEYIAASYQYYREAVKKVRELYSDLEREGSTDVAFYGAGEFAKIALHAMTGSTLHLTAIIDEKRKGSTFGGMTVKDSSALTDVKYDALLIATTESHQPIVDDILSKGVPAHKIRFF